MGDRVRKVTRKDGRDQGARSGRHGVMEEGREDGDHDMRWEMGA